MPRIKLKNLHGSWGTLEEGTNQIELHKALRNIPVPSKQFVLFHELGHQFLLFRKIKIKDKELFCDLYALSKCKPNELSLLERVFKKYLIKVYGRLTIKNILLILKDRVL